MSENTLLVTYPYEDHDDGVLRERLDEAAEQFDTIVYIAKHEESEDPSMRPYGGASFYDDRVVEDPERSDNRTHGGSIDTDDLELKGDVYLAGGYGQFFLRQTAESLDEEEIDGEIAGIVPELTYVHAKPVSKEEYLISPSDRTVSRGSGPIYPVMSKSVALDEVGEEPEALFDHAPYDEELDIVPLDEV